MAGSLNKHTGYCDLTIDYRTYRAHRLAWLYIHGNMPKQFIDHINGNKKDNRLSNLREANAQQNSSNLIKRPGMSSKYKGVSYHKRDKNWVARIKVNNVHIHLGYHDTELEAALAYDKASRQYHKEFSSPNFKDVDLSDIKYAVRLYMPS